MTIEILDEDQPKPTRKDLDRLSHYTPREIRRFTKWAMRTGFIRSRWFDNESGRRAYKLTGTGEFTGIVFYCLIRHHARRDLTWRTEVAIHGYNVTEANMFFPRGRVWTEHALRTTQNHCTVCGAAGATQRFATMYCPTHLAETYVYTENLVLLRR